MEEYENFKKEAKEKLLEIQIQIIRESINEEIEIWKKEALEKSIPMELKNTRCPRCNAWNVTQKEWQKLYKYCPHCGQAIDRRDE